MTAAEVIIGLDEAVDPMLREVEALVRPVVAENGGVLLDVEYRREAGGWVLRLVMDRIGGLLVDDCAVISREISNLLDVYTGIQAPYHLEVSSPGLTRSLKRRREFEHFSGSRVKVVCREPREGDVVFVGTLTGLEGDQIVIAEEGGSARSFGLETIKKVNLHPDDWD